MKNRTFTSFLRTLFGMSNREKFVDEIRKAHEEEQKIGLMVTNLRVESIQEAAKQMSRLLHEDSVR